MPFAFLDPLAHPKENRLLPTLANMFYNDTFAVDACHLGDFASGSFQ